MFTALAKAAGFSWPAAMVFGSTMLVVGWLIWVSQQPRPQPQAQ